MAAAAASGAEGRTDAPWPLVAPTASGARAQANTLVDAGADGSLPPLLAATADRPDESGLQRVAHAPASGGEVFLKVPDAWASGKTLALTLASGQRLVVAVPTSASCGSLLRVVVPSGTQGVTSLRLIAPAGATPGQTVAVNAAGRRVLVRLPAGVVPGQEYEFCLPAGEPAAPGAPGATLTSTPREASDTRDGAGGLLRRLGDSVAARVDAIWQHRRAGAPISAGLHGRYDQIKTFDDALDSEMYI
ncbi:hypothetical protein KFE25_003245 [Diacronema lutheri]|uniref:Uncharacterized protein n=1 Tax=Diacronema lutheri TaxID=2081491 RepID=A0A8J6C762_DIALT|nr:hypothetical protein KFE25_003245 [Diacronema lutheri]